MPGHWLAWARMVAQVFLGLAMGPAAWSSSAASLVSLGPRTTLLGDGEQGLRYFPDGALAIIERTPQYRLLMATGVRTTLLCGSDMQHLHAAGAVLAPGKAGAFDNGYAGVNAIYKASANELLAFYHAEDHEGLPRLANGIPGFYCSVGLAVSEDDGVTFRKLGPILTSSRPKNPHGPPDQGVGELCVSPHPTDKFLYMYYTSHSRTDSRGVQICMARCPVQAARELTAWRKFHAGTFEEPGLGGRETPVLSGEAMDADAIMPHVTYCAGLGKYVMVFCINAYREFGTAPQRSGIYVAFSNDGRCWPKRDQQQLLVGYTVPAQIGAEVIWHPTLVLDTDATKRTVKGWLYYSYSESWGHKTPHKTHYLVGAPIEFQADDADAVRSGPPR